MKIAFTPSQQVKDYIKNHRLSDYDLLLSNKKEIISLFKKSKNQDIHIDLWTWGVGKKISTLYESWLLAEQKKYSLKINISIHFKRIEEGLYRGFSFESPINAIYESNNQFLYYHRTENNNLSQILSSNWEISNTEQKTFKQSKELIQKYQLSKYNSMSAFKNLAKHVNAIESEHLKKFLELQITSLKTSLNTSLNTHKYNDDILLENQKILLIDQTFEDSSVIAGKSDMNTFKLCLLEALYQAQNHNKIYIKLHPQTVLGKKQGYFIDLLTQLFLDLYSYNKNFVISVVSQRKSPPSFIQKIPINNSHAELLIFWKNHHELLTYFFHQLGVVLIEENESILSLFPFIDQIRVVTSQVGFEGLLFDKKVMCYGASFYSFYGLTEDRMLIQNIKKNRSLAEVFIGLNLYCTRYFLNHEEINLLQHLHILSLQKRHQCQEKIVFMDTKLWKKDTLDHFCNQNTSFTYQSFEEIKKSNFPYRFSTWGFKKNMLELNKPIYMIEDGFIRSNGLGSNLAKPLSLIFDEKGIYFNPQQMSSLEEMINQETLTSYEIETAQKIRNILIEKKMTKYNVGIEDIPAYIQEGGFILVLGQVEDDASIEFGSIDFKTNLALLKHICQQNTDKKIIFKNHPDVISGNRKGLVTDEEVKSILHSNLWIENSINVAYLLDNCAELHVNTSTAGLEALIRGKPVHVYGGAFYSGYGMTLDHFDFSAQYHRKRKTISIDEFIAFAYMLYPRYKRDKDISYIDCLTAIEHLDKSKKFIKIEKNSWINQLKRRGIFCLKTLQAIMK